MLYAMTAACILTLTTFLVAEDCSVRESHARRARLYRAQVRWAAEMDLQAGRQTAAERWHVA